MIGFIIWIAGVVFTVMCVLDIFKKNISTPSKILVSVIVLLTSWIGLIVYYLFAKDKLEVWFNK
ncbi:PLDc N-terminal domain-containing protein [Bacteroidales bacterium OttesenSCG-928-K03]|nr:PLDc N-terminal domain-containing protein [Odoribacter sp. OttesenSCG-928-L07]MDL2239583.1 PLDc N-terminal domain-containing protein [Bacteroidales bacterium OttesenSCG-928-L14]MDL2242543.1 PLDc N-terminal domain-containing protein [Bacteroidales bacterium OttesenSCG-928-K03]